MYLFFRCTSSYRLIHYHHYYSTFLLKKIYYSYYYLFFLCISRKNRIPFHAPLLLPLLLLLFYFWFLKRTKLLLLFLSENLQRYATVATVTREQSEMSFLSILYQLEWCQLLKVNFTFSFTSPNKF
jgi:hypothetical protein